MKTMNLPLFLLTILTAHLSIAADRPIPAQAKNDRTQEIPFKIEDIDQKPEFIGWHTGIKAKAIQCQALGEKVALVYSWNSGRWGAEAIATEIVGVCSLKNISSYEDCRNEDSAQLRYCYNEFILHFDIDKPFAELEEKP